MLAKLVHSLSIFLCLGFLSPVFAQNTQLTKTGKLEKVIEEVKLPEAARYWSEHSDQVYRWYYLELSPHFYRESLAGKIEKIFLNNNPKLRISVELGVTAHVFDEYNLDFNDIIESNTASSNDVTGKKSAKSAHTFFISNSERTLQIEFDAVDPLTGTKYKRRLENLVIYIAIPEKEKGVVLEAPEYTLQLSLVSESEKTAEMKNQEKTSLYMPDEDREKIKKFIAELEANPDRCPSVMPAAKVFDRFISVVSKSGYHRKFKPETVLHKNGSSFSFLVCGYTQSKRRSGRKPFQGGVTFEFKRNETYHTYEVFVEQFVFHQAADGKWYSFDANLAQAKNEMEKAKRALANGIQNKLPPAELTALRKQLFGTKSKSPDQEGYVEGKMTIYKEMAEEARNNPLEPLHFVKMGGAFLYYDLDGTFGFMLPQGATTK